MPSYAANNDADTSSPIITRQANPRLKAPITLRAKDANLSEVLKILAERSGMNFVTGRGVHREKITIMLNKTPLDEAINLLVRAAGLSYEIVGNSVLIAEPGKLEEEVGQASYVVELKYAKAGEVAAMLADLTKNIKVDAGGNRLVCFTSPRVINEIEKIVKAIDHPHILIVLETRIIEVSADIDNSYGIDWGNFQPLQTRVTHGGPDAMTPVKIVDMYRADNWYKLPVDFNVKLDMLLANSDARILMNSKLTTTNNREASLHMGEIVPYTIQSYNIGGQGGANQQIMKEEVGVKMKITPHINELNQITLTMEPEVSNIIAWIGANNDLPYVRVRTTSTTVRVKDGQTIFLAGLLSEEEAITIKKLPLLGHIPIIGLLFQQRIDDTKRKNLVIEVTPRIIYDQEELSKGTNLKPINETRVRELEKNVGIRKKFRRNRNKKRETEYTSPPPKTEETEPTKKKSDTEF
jgi:type II secretory pathway component GspD/PulD (secretin)